LPAYQSNPESCVIDSPHTPLQDELYEAEIAELG
jgi:hypothetical protein